MISIKVTDFGPVVEGCVRLRPLTVFVGPNISGKSYMAILAYAVFLSLPPLHSNRWLWRGRTWMRFRPQPFLPGLEDFPPAELSKDRAIWGPLRERVRDLVSRPKGQEVKLALSELPSTMQSAFDHVMRSIVKESASTLSSELRRCYASEISDLVRKRSGRGGFTLEVIQDGPPLSVNFELGAEGNDLACTDYRFDSSSLSIDLRAGRNASLMRQMLRDREPILIYELILQFATQAFAEFLADPYYLPAARSGILQSHKALASYVVSRSSLAGIEKLPEIPRLPGVVADFIGNVLTLEKDRKSDLFAEAKFVESTVARGAIDIEAGKLEYPEIYYEPESGRFPLHRTSSMVSELAPIVLFLKYMINSGDFVIIEEPESHLHPESQRKLARAIVRLVRAGAKVLITTHSDYFVEQLGNFVKLSHASNRDRTAEGYSAKDYVEPNEVGAYLFDLDERQGGSIVSPLEITSEDGIPADEFARVFEALHEETVRLDRLVTAND